MKREKKQKNGEKKMKRWLLLAALLMLQYVPAYAERIHTYAAVNADKVNVRQKPGGKISEQLNRGTWVYILEEKKQSDRTCCVSRRKARTEAIEAAGWPPNI